MKISGIVRQTQESFGQKAPIKEAKVVLHVGDRELATLTTDRLGRYGYEEDSDYPGAKVSCQVSASRYQPKTETAVMTQSELQLDIELELVEGWLAKIIAWFQSASPGVLGVIALASLLLIVVITRIVGSSPDPIPHPPSPHIHTGMVPTWTAVGLEAFTPGNARQVDLQVAKGVPYVAFQDLTQGQKGTVMAYKNGQWFAVGNPGLSSGKLSLLRIAVGKGQPWVAYRDSSEDFKLAVRQLVGKTWKPVGPKTISKNRISQFVSLRVHGGYPVVGYWALGVPNRAYVQKWNGTHWEMLGGKPVVQGTISYFQIAVDGQDVYAAYALGNNRALSIKRFDKEQWVHFGRQDETIIPIKLATHTFDFAASNQEAYIAFSNQDHQGKLSVARVTGDGTTLVGASPTMSKGTVDYPSITVSPKAIYVAFKDKGRDNRSVAYQWHKSKKGDWEPIEPEFSDPKASGLALAVDEAGVPYVAFQEGKKKGWKLSVLRGDPKPSI